jgi:hypothetical protein
MNNLALGVAVCSFAAAATAVVPSRAGSGVPELVERAAAYNVESVSGFIVEQRHVNLNVSAGPAHYSEQNEAVVLLEDGEYKHVRYVRIVKNGRPLSNDQVAQRETQNNDDLAHGKMYFKQPFDARYFHDYTYAEDQCACGSHEKQIAFHSDMRDDQHGNGTMRIDASSGRVTNLTYSPNVLPPHASTATTVETFGEPVPGVWTIVSIDRTYTGHVAFFQGSGTMTERLDHFQRFGSPVAAMEYLQRTSM